MYIYYFPIISTLKKGRDPSFEKKKQLGSSSLKDPLCQVVFFSSSQVPNVFLLFHNYLPFEKGVALHLNRLESPSKNHALCQVWLKFDQWFWRNLFLKVVNLLLLFPNYLPLKKGGALHLNKLEFLFTQGSSVPSLVEISPVVLEKIFKSCQFIFIISQSSPIWEGRGPSFEQT